MTYTHLRFCFPCRKKTLQREALLDVRGITPWRNPMRDAYGRLWECENAPNCKPDWEKGTVIV